jgi:DNA-directed RNA polymerase specialized sigma24 family protein
MIAIPTPRPRRRVPKWHARFLTFLPVITTYARTAFADRDPESREDLVEEVVVNALIAFKRLYDKGKIDIAYPSVLARYGICQVRDHRRAGCRLNVRDVSSEYAQQRKGFKVDRLDRFDTRQNAWMEVLVEDRRSGPAETAACRLDFAAWLRSLPKRDRKMAVTLATGETTGEAAKRFNVSPSRVSQVRRQLQQSWNDFVGEGDAAND